MHMASRTAPEIGLFDLTAISFICFHLVYLIALLMAGLAIHRRDGRTLMPALDLRHPTQPICGDDGEPEDSVVRQWRHCLRDEIAAVVGWLTRSST
jgi:hypothetical protein